MTQEETMQLLAKINSMDTSSSWASSPVDLSLTHHSSNQISSSGALLSLARSTSSTPPMTPNVFNIRKQREFIPDSKKDESYWDRRRRNNEAAKRSREKRRISDVLLEQRVLELTRENQILRAELFAIKEKFGIPPNHQIIDPNSVNLPLPENNCRGRRNKLLSAVIPGNIFTTGPNGSSVNGSTNVNGNSGHNSNNNSNSSNSNNSSNNNCGKENVNESLAGSILAAYVSASSPLSSSSSLSDSAVGCSTENQPSQSTSPTCSISSSPMASNGTTPSLPHKLRHKAATRHTCNEVEPPNDHQGTQNGNCGSSSSSTTSSSSLLNSSSPSSSSTSTMPATTTSTVVTSKVTVREKLTPGMTELGTGENGNGASGASASGNGNSSSNNNNNNSQLDHGSNSGDECSRDGREGSASSLFFQMEEDIITAEGTTATASGRSLLLKQENYTLRQELARLACEVASLKTILVPASNSPGSGSVSSHVCPPAETRIRAHSVASSPPMDITEGDRDEEMMDSDTCGGKDDERRTHGHSSSCDSSSEENNQ